MALRASRLAYQTCIGERVETFAMPGLPDVSQAKCLWEPARDNGGTLSIEVSSPIAFARRLPTML
ncbi:hypothetical protein AXG94_00300 [Pseudomonas corrugata]|nr:hypothetical protein AXG94_00300 [Pseudomonas corrugata]